MQEQLADQGLSNKIVSGILNAFLEVYKEAIVENDRVEIRGFGVIKSELIRGRLISHPETGEKVIASPYYRISFIPAQTFREQLRARAKAEAVKK